MTEGEGNLHQKGTLLFNWLRIVLNHKSQSAQDRQGRGARPAPSGEHDGDGVGRGDGGDRPAVD